MCKQISLNSSKNEITNNLFTYKSHVTVCKQMIYSKEWVGLFGFYGISTFIGYLMQNPFYANSSISNNSV